MTQEGKKEGLKGEGRIRKVWVLTTMMLVGR
jgi:hypothetical protein